MRFVYRAEMIHEKVVFVLIGLSALLKVIASQTHDTICSANYTCVPFSHCQDDGNIRYICNEQQTRVCCPPGLIKVMFDAPGIPSFGTRIFPQQCGMVGVSDRITGGQLASIGQFPWMALLGYKQPGLNTALFLCGGSIITKEFILTAAHCINVGNILKLAIVRLGELNLESEIDCEPLAEDSACADKYVDVPIGDIIFHEGYNSKSLENDIALLKLQTAIPKFTEFIQPICLPTPNNDIYKTTPNKNLLVSGWGKTSSGNVGGSVHLQFTEVKLWSQEQCNSSVPNSIRPIKESQICANGARRQDACKGDSGGPLINTTVIDGDVRSFQVGIVSFASAQVCGNPELPSIYTKVEYYMEWITSKIT